MLSIHTFIYLLVQLLSELDRTGNPGPTPDCTGPELIISLRRRIKRSKTS